MERTVSRDWVFSIAVSPQSIGTCVATTPPASIAIVPIVASVLFIDND